MDGEKFLRGEVERRDFLKRAAVVAWATPAIMTLAASRAGAQSASFIGPGQPCSPSSGTPCARGLRCKPTGSGGFRCIGPPTGYRPGG